MRIDSFLSDADVKKENKELQGYNKELNIYNDKLFFFCDNLLSENILFQRNNVGLSI